MRYLVLSDTHGNLSRAVKAYEAANAAKPVDAIIHLGDGAKEAEELSWVTEKEVISLRGNCDGYYDPEGYRLLETPWGKVFLSHGHMESVKRGPEELIQKARNLGCHAAFFGHTHIPVYDHVFGETGGPGGFVILNPGSIGLPMGGRKPTYAVVQIEERAKPFSTDLTDGFSASLYTLDETVTGGRANGHSDEHYLTQSGFRR